MKSTRFHWAGSVGWFLPFDDRQVKKQHGRYEHVEYVEHQLIRESTVQLSGREQEGNKASCSSTCAGLCTETARLGSLPCDGFATLRGNVAGWFRGVVYSYFRSFTVTVKSEPFPMTSFSSRMRSEGFSAFNSRGLGVEHGRALFVTRCLSVCNRPQPFATDRAVRMRTVRPLPFGEAFGVSLAWKRDVSDSCEIARNHVER